MLLEVVTQKYVEWEREQQKRANDEAKTREWKEEWGGANEVTRTTDDL